MSRRNEDNGTDSKDRCKARHASARLPIPVIIAAHHSTKNAVLGLLLCAIAVIYAGCGGGGSTQAPAPLAPEQVLDAAAEDTVTLTGVVYGPSEISGESRMSARSASNTTGRDLPIHGATVIPCELDENGDLIPIQGISADTDESGAFILAGVPARKNIVLVARREITVNGHARVFTVKSVVILSDTERMQREKGGVALDPASTLVVECMRDIVLESRLRGKGAIRGADISTEALETLHAQMQAALAIDQTEPVPVVDLLDVTTGQEETVTGEFKELVNQTPGGGEVQDTVQDTIETTTPAPAPEPAPAPVLACTASTQISGGMSAQGHRGHGRSHHGQDLWNLYKYWKQSTDKNWRKHCRSGRGTHCVRVHVVGIQGSGGPLQDATVTFTADGFSQVQTTDAKGNAYFSNVPYATKREVTAVKNGYKMIRTSRNIKKARTVWNVVVMMGYDEAASACCADTDCDDGDTDTADTCMNPGQAAAVCENTPHGSECDTDADCGSGFCVNGGTASAVCVSCTSDTHCDDSAATTIDTCTGAGTEAAACAYTPAVCAANMDCDDLDDYTTDTCENPGTSAATCTHAPIACLADSECSDGNALTLDSCMNPGTTTAACTHTAIACASDANCNDGNAYTADICANPGTAASSCTHPAIACLSDADCQDGYASTIDTCTNPGTTAATCTRTTIACFSAGDCNDGNAYTQDACTNAGSASAACTHTPIACLSAADCNDGNSGTIDTCENPGTTSSVCKHTADDGWITIPAGSFPRGCTAAEPGCMTDAQPQSQIYLNEYRIMKNSVTNEQYRQCVAAGACAAPLASSSYSRTSYFGNAVYADFPVIYVSWSNAEAYCNFTGGRLPTESEWEKAARGTTTRTYPWGEATPACTLANAFIGSALCVGDTSRVGSLTAGASPYGAFDMAGNTLEWTRDWYDGAYYASSPASNPTGPASGTYKVIRGGSWHHNTLYLRTTYRSVKFPNSASNDISFRCVK